MIKADDKLEEALAYFLSLIFPNVTKLLLLCGRIGERERKRK